ncbi:hypothetical protein NBRC110019_06320 [Neptunitalea chrysea]|uniref:Uncharacterized protein n=1 Tax=Neptunitalea chrysea TaxID=1647581 RepID=A0A9W6EVI9_9FLAO|nr:hypothetical protein NBRC110019_06320 [Neptunitalea chrysea]
MKFTVCKNVKSFADVFPIPVDIKISRSNVPNAQVASKLMASVLPETTLKAGVIR